MVLRTALSLAPSVRKTTAEAFSRMNRSSLELIFRAVLLLFQVLEHDRVLKLRDPRQLYPTGEEARREVGAWWAACRIDQLGMAFPAQEQSAQESQREP